VRSCVPVVDAAFDVLEEPLRLAAVCHPTRLSHPEEEPPSDVLREPQVRGDAADRESHWKVVHGTNSYPNM
jgi:hypothetical protein